MKSMEQAHAEKAVGITRATKSAENSCPGWSDTALAFLRAYAESHSTFEGWRVTEAAAEDSSFPTPPNDKSWGAVYQRACKSGVIEDSGKTAKHPGRHASKCIVWQSLVYTTHDGIA